MSAAPDQSAGVVLSHDSPARASPKFLPRVQPLVVLLLAACAGIVTDRLAAVPLGCWWLVAIGSWLAWLPLWRGGHCRWSGVLLLVAAASCGGLWHHCSWRLFRLDDLGLAAGAAEPVAVEVMALQSAQFLPQPAPDPMRVFDAGPRTRFDVRATAVRDGQSWRPASGRARLTVLGRTQAVRPGDRLRVFARMEGPARARNPGEFDLARHLRVDRTLTLLQAESPACMISLQRGAPWRPRSLIDVLRQHGHALLQRQLDGEQASLAAALVLGDRSQFAHERQLAFQATGTIHLLAVSGLHVAILFGPLWIALRRLPFAPVVPLSMVTVLALLYMLVTGAQPPVVRATVLLLVMLLALTLRRRSAAMNALAAAGLVVLWLNPAELFQIGTQLSFLAVAGLFRFAPHEPESAAAGRDLEALPITWADHAVHWLRPAFRRLWRVTQLSALVWLLSLPLVLARFHLATPIAVVANPPACLFTWLGLLSGFLLVLFGGLPLVGGALGWVLGGLCNTSLGLLQTSVDLFCAAPLGHAWLPGPDPWWLLGFYGGLGLLAALPAGRIPRRWQVALLATWITLGFAAGAASQRGHDTLRCVVLDVGHGCAVVVELPDGRILLYDAGRLGYPEPAAMVVSEYLWSQGRTHVDAVVLSHNDIDHFNALPALLEKFSVGVVYVSPVMFEAETPTGLALRESMERAGVPLRTLRANDRLEAGVECSVDVLHPPAKGVLGSDNANSVVLAIEYRGRRILLAGDLEPPGLNALLAEEPCDCDLLLSPHHGSRRSNDPALLAWCQPEWLVVSGDTPARGAAVNIGLPDKCRLRSTRDAGAVTVTIADNSTGLILASHLPDPDP